MMGSKSPAYMSINKGFQVVDTRRDPCCQTNQAINHVSCVGLSVSNSSQMNSAFYSAKHYKESFNTIPSFPRELEMSDNTLISLDSPSNGKTHNHPSLDNTLESLVPHSFRGNSKTAPSSNKSLKNPGKSMSIGRVFMLMQIESAAGNSISSHIHQPHDRRREEQPAVHSQRIICFSPSTPDNDNIHCSSSSSSSSSYTRLRWTGDLHERFVQCVNHLGGAKKATPKEILGLMNYDGLTLFQVKSHLQKYRTSKYNSGSTEGMQIADVLRMQTDIHKRLCEELEDVRNLQLQIEEQSNQLQNMIDQLTKIEK